MSLLNRDQILGAADRRHVEVDVPEWGGRVRLIEMTAAQRDAYHSQMYKAKEAGEVMHVRAAYLCRCIVDEKNQPMFAASDIEDLGAKSHQVLDRIFDAATKLNEHTEEAQAELPKP